MIMKTYKQFILESKKPQFTISVDLKTTKRELDKIEDYLRKQNYITYLSKVLSPASDDSEMVVVVMGEIRLDSQSKVSPINQLGNIKKEMSEDLKKIFNTRVSISSVI